MKELESLLQKQKSEESKKLKRAQENIDLSTSKLAKAQKSLEELTLILDSKNREI